MYIKKNHTKQIAKHVATCSDFKSEFCGINFTQNIKQNTIVSSVNMMKKISEWDSFQKCFAKRKFTKYVANVNQIAG